MDYKYDVSVLFMTYHPDLKKTLCSLSMILNQKSCSFEIVIADDGSQVDYFEEIKRFFDERQFCAYTLVKNVDNVGTVCNIYSALSKASGKYVFCTSPGDCLFDDTTLHDFFNYAQQHQADVVFGDYVCYSVDENNQVEFHEANAHPAYPEIYNKKSKLMKLSLFSCGGDGNYILGAVILREHQCFIEALEKIIDDCKYVEDNTTIAYMLMEDKKVLYYNRYFVFYEYGTGVSSNNNDKWVHVLGQDFLKCYKKMLITYPGSFYIKALYYLHDHQSTKIERIIGYLKCPPVLLGKIYTKLVHPHRLCYHGMKTDYIQNFLNEELRL